MHMHSGFVISQTDGRPMYLQIMEQIKQRVAVGDWKPNQEIPSIRQLAVELKVSVITIKRAYLELEREGVILTLHGKGSFVAAGQNVGPNLFEKELGKHLEAAVRAAALLGLDREQLESRLRELSSGLTKEQA